jgi:hypothetical protein
MSQISRRQLYQDTATTVNGLHGPRGPITAYRYTVVPIMASKFENYYGFGSYSRMKDLYAMMIHHVLYCVKQKQ